MAVTDLVGALRVLRDGLGSAELPLAVGSVTTARLTRRAATEQIDDYLIPRLESLDAPLLAVVGGSTGSGKSTLVNSLVGHPVSKPGVLRPTTRHPVLVHNPAEGQWFADDRVLPRLPRITGSDPGAVPGAAELPGGAAIFGLHLVARPEIPAGLALLDAPDLDSVAQANRELAAVLLGAADLWLFVTSAARYSDAVPWAALRGAAARNAAVALVLNRVPAEALGQVSTHLRQLLAAEGLGSAPLFVVAETTLEDTLIPSASLRPLTSWLQDLSADSAARTAIARRTLEGAIEHVVAASYQVADAVDEQWSSAARLRDVLDPPFRAAAERILNVSTDGSLLRGEVLARWQEYVGAGQAFRRMESTVARWRDRVAASFRGEPAAPERVVEAIESGLASVIVGELATACEQADSAWRAEPAGVALLGADDLAHPPPDAARRAAALVHDWQGDVLELIRSEGADRRSTARAMAFGVNGVALTLMIVVFSATGGVTGAEVGIAGGASVLAQKVLEAVFSEDGVRRMAAQAKVMLAQRVQAYLDEAAEQFRSRLAPLPVDQYAGAGLRQAAARVAMLSPDAPPVDLPPAREAVRAEHVELAKPPSAWRRWWRGR